MRRLVDRETAVVRIRAQGLEAVQAMASETARLDSEALKTAKLFRFRPGERRGEPVPVRVGIVLEFNVR